MEEPKIIDYAVEEQLEKEWQPSQSEITIPSSASISMMLEEIKRRFKPSGSMWEPHSHRGNQCLCNPCKSLRAHLFYTMQERLEELECPNYHGYDICEEHAYLYSDWVPKSDNKCNLCRANVEPNRIPTKKEEAPTIPNKPTPPTKFKVVKTMEDFLAWTKIAPCITHAVKNCSVCSVKKQLP